KGVPPDLEEERLWRPRKRAVDALDRRHDAALAVEPHADPPQAVARLGRKAEAEVVDLDHGRSGRGFDGGRVLAGREPLEEPALAGLSGLVDEHALRLAKARPLDSPRVPEADPADADLVAVASYQPAQVELQERGVCVHPLGADALV